jgi:hypothetical protein
MKIWELTDLAIEAIISGAVTSSEAESLRVLVNSAFYFDKKRQLAQYRQTVLEIQEIIK